MITTITGKNQVTLPAELVRELDWKPGTQLEWTKTDDGRLIASRKPTRGELARSVMGLVKAKPGSDPVEELQRTQEEEDETL